MLTQNRGSDGANAAWRPLWCFGDGSDDSFNEEYLRACRVTSRGAHPRLFLT
jgi:hypothetical protein